MLARSTWGTGQDQCATIKRQLAAMLPGVKIFLDVRKRRTINSRPLRQIPSSALAPQGIVPLLVAVNARPSRGP